MGESFRYEAQSRDTSSGGQRSQQEDCSNTPLLARAHLQFLDAVVGHGDYEDISNCIRDGIRKVEPCLIDACSFDGIGVPKVVWVSSAHKYLRQGKGDGPKGDECDHAIVDHTELLVNMEDAPVEEED